VTRAEYAEYLQSDHWKAMREAALERAGRKCQTCAATHRLEVHHNTYARIGCEDMTDLVVLCRECHAMHRKEPPLDIARMSTFKPSQECVDFITALLVSEEARVMVGNTLDGLQAQHPVITVARAVVQGERENFSDEESELYSLATDPDSDWHRIYPFNAQAAVEVGLQYVQRIEAKHARAALRQEMVGATGERMIELLRKHQELMGV